ncbi:LysE/ArgO family amino acid transporter [Chitinilyticum piscinae]|uniref:Amino acid transporter n=1 Tax=Chitinilyticum piscinae TaxID=2866724 RepID=A0A8J7FKP3_9NEIS|nr:LysE/ArgO family amino acid transporter [Chitinilyticum piscinae]MBE9609465.1 amino acid transporter [Chitinilyticum piscinae]
MSTSVYFQGLGLCASLIMAIGAQNAHVLRMGLARQHVVPTIAICIVLDCILITLGVAGMGKLIEDTPLLLAITRWGGAAFLVWYGLRAWRSALSSNQLDARGAPALDRRTAIITVLTLSLLNPHVYLDTVLLVGSIGGQQAPDSRPAFVLGAWTASALWFISLGFGARLLAPLFARPLAWRILDGLIGAVMLLIAALLVI